MLVLARYKGQKIVINGNITLEVKNIHNGEVVLGIEAPREVPIRRSELYVRKEQKQDGAVNKDHQ